MNGTRISPRDKRALLVGSALLLIFVLSFKAAPAYRRWEVNVTVDARELLTDVSATERAIAVFALVVDSLETRTERFLVLSERLAAGNASVRTAGALASWVSLAATEASTKLGAVYVRPDSTGSGIERITVTGDFTGDIRGLTNFLRAIEGGSLHMAVTELAVDQSDPAGDRTHEELRVRFAVEALLMDGKTK